MQDQDRDRHKALEYNIRQDQHCDFKLLRDWYYLSFYEEIKTENESNHGL